ncbi:MAG TPA: arginine deiminase-related protein [Burkholderiaceae bacterium]|nr:arginine deiminase-related protein [Burkholderiaceae bacterium]
MNAPVVLMCPPRHFNVDYEINPWMRGHLNSVDTVRAARQWQQLHDTLARFAELRLVEARAGLPDMVFTANAGLVAGNIAIPSNFAHAERQGEREHFARWFANAGFNVVDMPHTGPDAIDFEGAGDALYATDEPLLWVGHGFRTDPRAVEWLRAQLNVEVIGLRLIDPHYYHLDTCFCPLIDGQLLWNPLAFDEASRAVIEARVPASRRIAVAGDDAASFACNAVNLGDAVVLNHISPALRDAIVRHGLQPVELALSEFMKSGGAAKCLTLRLDTGFAPWASERFAAHLARAA